MPAKFPIGNGRQTELCLQIDRLFDGVIFGRAQRDMSYSDGTGVWTAGFDILTTYTGVLPSAQNAGSVSIQPFPGSQSFIALARWTDATTATRWRRTNLRIW